MDEAYLKDLARSSGAILQDQIEHVSTLKLVGILGIELNSTFTWA